MAFFPFSTFWRRFPSIFFCRNIIFPVLLLWRFLLLLAVIALICHPMHGTQKAMEFTICGGKYTKMRTDCFFFLPAIAWLASIISSLLAAIEREEIGQTPRPRCRHSVEKDISHCTPSQLKTYAITFKCNENTIAPIDYEIIMKTKFQNKYKMAMTMQWYFPSKLVFFRVRTSKRKKQNPGTSFGSISLPIFA